MDTKHRIHITLTLATLITLITDGCANPLAGDEQPELISNPLVFGADGRLAMTDDFFAARPQWRAMGLLDTATGYCSATVFSSNHILTSRHCFGDADQPNQLVFRPGFVGQRTAANYAKRPSIRGKRVVRGTGSNGHIDSGGTYVPGADWLVVELDPSTYERGSGGSGIVTAPNAFAEWPAISIASLDKPIPTSGIAVTTLGYSGDFFTSTGAAGYDATCKLVKDGSCSNEPNHIANGKGIVLTDCDYNPGASGGPVVIGGLDHPQIVAINGGGGVGSVPTWTEGDANVQISSNSWAFAPVRAAGFTATATGNGELLGFATDSHYFNGVRQVSLDSEDGYRPADQWYDSRDGGLQGLLSFGRATSALTRDGHGWIFATANGQIWNKFESSPGQWQNWQTWFSGSNMANTPIDIEARAAGATAMQLYTLHRTGEVRTRRKLGTWDANWEGELSIGTVPGGNAIAVSDTGGFQQIFAATATGIQTQWEINAPSSNQWSGWFNFADGLPTIVTSVLDVAAGSDSQGRMDVYLLAQTSRGTRIYRRGKTTPVPGSAWSAWSQFDSDPKLAAATQIEVMTRSGQTNFAPRLVVIGNGELLTRRYNAPAGFPDRWVPLYSPANVPCP